MPFSEVDVVVVGAGAAGLAAARELGRRGISAVVVEARGRMGGRAHTVLSDGGHPADLGCGWLHSADRNPWCAIAEGLGLEIDRNPPDWGQGSVGRRIGREAMTDWAEAMERFWDLIDRVGDAGPDRSVADLLPAGDRWLPRFEAVIGYISGAEPGALSAVDLVRYADTGVNWRVASGYGTLVARAGAGVHVSLDTPVTSVDLTGPRIVLTTPKGELCGRAVILTVPPPLLDGEAIRFTPPLPEKIEAARALPMGYVAKLFLEVVEGSGCLWDLEPDTQVPGALDGARTGLYHLEPLGRPLIEAYYGGALALDLERAGAEAMEDFAVGELSGLFGSSVRRHLKPVAASGWAADPWSLGAYSYAVPGGADRRADLVLPVDGRLFFAGEACSRDSYSTTHGAYLTGIDAAAAAAAVIRPDGSRP
ncbi:flavin monoamine oxidase family protein [Skermanella pratensis]|uniref:flavin monoamine oxidase family protein n=1 Tax=Skermanella pratensis TaxID=2233999 RepID=UPI001300DF63|nr:NAD(P)/FAD-dependent oxidoreductase [Skermanella pratensis]